MFLLLFSFQFLISGCRSEVISLDSNNWTDSLHGEWLLEFYAPWCPACQQFASVMQELSEVPELPATVATIDITQNPLLTFIFFVKHLPTIYHSKDGEFRLFNDTRTLTALQRYVLQKKYLESAPLPWYYSPASMHMRILLKLLDLSMVATRVHQNVVAAGYAPWMSFLLIAACVIFVGLLLGLLMVILCDCICPPRPQILRLFRQTKRPAPIITKENDSDQESLTADTDPTTANNTETGDAGSTRPKIKRSKPKVD